MQTSSDPPQPLDLGALYSRHAAGLAGAVRTLAGQEADIQEVIQEALLRAWRAIQNGVQPREPASWLFVITLNTARDLRRRRFRRPRSLSLSDMDVMHHPTDKPQATHPLDRKEEIRRARSAIDALSDREKEVFVLRIAAELSFESIAAALEIPVGTAKTRMRTALARMRDLVRPRLETGERS